MKAVAQHFIGTTQEWQSANPKLYKAVWGFEITPEGRRYAKLGDGERLWNDLPYFDETNLHGLHEALQALTAGIEEEASRAAAAEGQLQHNIDARETFHDETLTGNGIAGDPLSVVPGALSLNQQLTMLSGDGTEQTFALPGNFMFTRLSIVEVNGIGQAPGADYTIDADAKTIIFADAPEAGDTVMLYYSATN